MRAVMLLILVGCSDGATTPNSPLVGKWSADYGSGGVTTRQTYELRAGGALIVSYVGIGDCSGTLTYSGGTWSATATTLTLSDGGTNSQCTGGVTCTIMGMQVTPLTCGPGLGTPTTSSYALSNDNNTLTIGDGAFAQTFTRS